MVGDIASSNSALGVIFDKCMKVDYHISSVCIVDLLIFISVTLVAFYQLMHVPN